MASELKVDKITGVTTAGSIDVTGEGNSTTTNLQQGLVKAWVNYTTVSTTTNQDSFNVDSLTDGGTGETTITFTNVMNTTNYSPLATCGEILSTAATRISHLGTKTTSTIRVHTTTTSGVDDVPDSNVGILGDLA